MSNHRRGQIRESQREEVLKLRVSERREGLPAKSSPGCSLLQPCLWWAYLARWRA